MKTHRQVIATVSQINSHFFAPLIVLTLGLMTIDMVTYQGFVAKAIIVSPGFFILCSAISYALLIVDTVIRRVSFTKESMLVLRANVIGFPLLIITNYLFMQLEASNYANYVFATFHIGLAGLKNITIFSSFLLFLYFFRQSLERISLEVKVRDNPRSFYGSLLFYVLMLLFISLQLFKALSYTTQLAADILRHPFYSREERRRQVFGTSYDLFSFISRHTPEKSRIAVPPQNKWGILGNIGFSRYFLYPRFLLHPEDYAKTDPNIDYYIVGSRYLKVDGSEYDIWPDQPLEAESIILFDEIGNAEELLSKTSYDPSDPIYKGKWALVKVRKSTP